MKALKIAMANLDFSNQLIDTDWHWFFRSEESKPYWHELMKRVENAYTTNFCYPPKGEIFQALLRTPKSKVKIVILGQDPYHQPGQAHGLSFSVPSHIPTPPSLRNIFKELVRDPSTEPPLTNDLSGWADQGVLLLNTWLTVEANKPASHRHFGWEQLTDACIKHVSDSNSRVVFILWGAAAQTKVEWVDSSKHLVLMSPHPSPLSAHRGFLGCGHFSKANDWLESQGLTAIDWACGNRF